MLHQFRNQLEFLDPHARGQARGHQNRACHRRLQRWLPNCRTRAAGGANHLDANLCTRRRSSEEVKKASEALQEQLMFVYLVEWLLKCEGQSPASTQTNKHEQENLDVE